MVLTKLYQVVGVRSPGKVWRTHRTEQECEDFMVNNDLDDYMSDVELTIRPIWTNASEASIKRLLREDDDEPSEEGSYL